jgi:hypothetical protein
VPSGLLTLSESLTRSCNPFFWEVGYTLYYNERQNDIANMARAFGLGQPTGIGQIEEAAGQITDPPTDIDMVNQSIGQGDVLVTPLQVASFVAALANGGTLYRPQLVERIEPVDGGPATQVFKPEARGTLPLQPFRLDLIREAMIGVARDPRGTAYFRMRGSADSLWRARRVQPNPAAENLMPGSPGTRWQPRTPVCRISPSRSCSKTSARAPTTPRRSSSASWRRIITDRLGHYIGSNRTSV